jgi:fructosamine-3-kinase
MNLKLLEEILSDKISLTEPLGGGCIARTSKITTDSGQVFVLKEVQGDVCQKEANGLAELKKSGAIQIPKVIFADAGMLILEFIQSGRISANFFTDFGKALADLHRYKSSAFGFFEDNYIGSNHQINTPVDNNWLTFYFEKRLLTQFKLAEKNGYVDDQFSALFKNLENKFPNILAGSEEPPSLIHGDLWQGNFLIGPSAEPVLIDPAVYYGHREAELAMTKLFGGFPESFYNAYKLAYPLKPGYEYREGIYSLYHVLNHLNLFGSGYKSQAISLMKLYL